MTDSQRLLAAYTQNRADPAFRELVTRYIDLVYSTAFRIVAGDAHQAKDVTQIVFAQLAQKASELPPDIMLGGWLHRHTCFVAANAMRSERRRHAREREAVEMNSLQQDVTEDFSHLAPLLDETINQLAESDRIAILLRFFEQKDFRAVGHSLDSSEAAARMRVNRALDKLRELLAKRGIHTTAGALSIVIAANAVQAAPAGLAVTISAAALAGTAAATSTLVAATTKTIAMTTLQKTLITATVAVLAGAGIYQARQTHNARAEVQALQRQQAPLAEQIQQLQAAHDNATNQLSNLMEENARLKSNPQEMELLRLRGQVAVASRAAADAATKTQGQRNGAQADPDYQRSQARAHLDQFFKLTNLSPEKADQYVDLEVEMNRRQDARLKGLLSGTLSVADAVRQRDRDNQEQQNQRRALLGPDGWATLQSIADGMRDGVAKRLIDAVQANMGNNPLTQEQSDRLRGAIKAEVAANSMDDTDLFRPVDEWTQMVTDHQQHVLQSASEFLTPEQQETLQFLERANLAQLLQQREQRRKAIGISQ